MTRGKEAIAAANRRAAAAVAADIETYRRTVASLTAERNALRDKLQQTQADSAALVRRLRAERDEATGPSVAALRLKLERAQIEKQQLRATVADELVRILVKYRAQFPHQTMGAACDALTVLLGRPPFPPELLFSREARRNVGKLKACVDEQRQAGVKVKGPAGLTP